MPRLVFFLLISVALASLQPAQAQKIIEKSVNLAKGQRVYLNLKHATNIRIRAGAAGRLALRAAVDINQGKANEALLLSQEQTAEELTFITKLDKERLQNGQMANCPDGGAHYGDNYVTRNKKGNYGVDKSDGHSSYSACVRVDYDITVPADVTLRVSTISGDIDIVGLTGDIDAKSISGFVDVTWPGQAAEVSFKTITGEVYTDQDVAFSNHKPNPIVGYQLHGSLGSKGPLVKLESISNDVYFRKRK
ncbi:hypothetical protein GCM10023185_42880 [Hymenobacter saemangeumensis]|uniref:Adhesin domain-containing protein n=1 Tax=Hymenobacter saemangeumensis TaxID=1084522 RepID=A0ABP8IRT3_9BACT